MDKRKLILVLCLLLCTVLDLSNGKRTHVAGASQISITIERSGSEALQTRDSFSETELAEISPCSNCSKNQITYPASIADKINSSRNKMSPASRRDGSRISRTRVAAVPKGSEKITFSRKYNPGVGSENDGFVPVTGPFGNRKTEYFRENSVKLPSDGAYKSGPVSRSANAHSKRSHGKNHHTQRKTTTVKQPRTVQRRAQYRHPKVREDLAVRESISSENILGNGNFEIITGGIFSDQDANEILGSRRVSRGFGSYVMPTYRQNQKRFTSSQNVQFPPFYQRHVQNPMHPMFFPRAPY